MVELIAYHTGGPSSIPGRLKRQNPTFRNEGFDEGTAAAELHLLGGSAEIRNGSPVMIWKWSPGGKLN